VSGVISLFPSHKVIVKFIEVMPSSKEHAMSM
jgi:hypothetical protein